MAGDSMRELRRNGRIVIVGASLAGLRAAERLTEEGFTGSLTVIGDESHEPYDRPPLSKQVLLGRVAPEDTALPRQRPVEARWLLGVAATGLDLDGKKIILAGGDVVEFDRLLIATGVESRPWPNPGEAALDGVFVLRTRDDAAGLNRGLARRPGRVLVIGGGFTGSEIASVCRERGLEVTVAERGPAPLVGALGGVVGAVAAALQREHGVDLRCGITVTALEGNARGQLRRAHLSDGSVLDVEVAVIALGAVRNTAWLKGSGLAAGPRGIACDAGCRAFDIHGIVTDDVFAAGDVARSPHPLFGYQFLSLEHWGNAVAQAGIAAHNMVSAASAPPAPVDARLLVGAVRGQHQVGRGAHDGRRTRRHPGLAGRAPLRRRVRPPGPRHRGRRLRPREVDGLLPAADRAGGAVPAVPPGNGPAGVAAGARRVPGPGPAQPWAHRHPDRARPQ